MSASHVVLHFLESEFKLLSHELVNTSLIIYLSVLSFKALWMAYILFHFIFTSVAAS